MANTHFLLAHIAEYISIYPSSVFRLLILVKHQRSSSRHRPALLLSLSLLSASLLSWFGIGSRFSLKAPRTNSIFAKTSPLLKLRIEVLMLPAGVFWSLIFIEFWSRRLKPQQ